MGTTATYHVRVALHIARVGRSGHAHGRHTRGSHTDTHSGTSRQSHTKTHASQCALLLLVLLGWPSTQCRKGGGITGVALESVVSLRVSTSRLSLSLRRPWSMMGRRCTIAGTAAVRLRGSSSSFATTCGCRRRSPRARAASAAAVHWRRCGRRRRAARRRP